MAEHVTDGHVAENVGRFFSADNRSMMGGWTRAERTNAEQAAVALEGSERQAAQEAIEARLQQERSQFGADYNADKPT